MLSHFNNKMKYTFVISFLFSRIFFLFINCLIVCVISIRLNNKPSRNQQMLVAASNLLWSSNDLVSWQTNLKKCNSNPCLGEKKEKRCVLFRTLLQ